MSSSSRTTILRHLRRALRVASWTVGVVLLAILAVVLLPPSREFLLHKAIDLAGKSLTGEITVDHARWPGLGRLEVDGLVWADGPDTLARVDTLRLAIDLSDLLHRDLTVRRVLLAGVTADVPAIQQRLPAPAAPADSATTPASPPPFPRAGSLPPVPSVAVERLALRRLSVVVAPDQVVDLDSLTVSVELRHDHAPSFGVAVRAELLPEISLAWRLAGTADTDTLALDLAPLHLAASRELPEPSALPLVGRLALPMAFIDSTLAGRPAWPALDLRRLAIIGEVGQWRLDAHLDGRRPGYVVMQSALAEAPDALIHGLMAAGADSLAPGMLDTLVSRWARDVEPGFELRIDVEPPPADQALLTGRVTVKGELRLPAISALAPLLPPQLDVENLGAILADLDLRYDGQARPPHFTANIDLGATEWLDRASIAASGDTASVRLDSLVIRLPGLALFGAGTASRDSVHAEIDLHLPDGSLLQRWRDPAPGLLDTLVSRWARDVEPGFELRIDVERPPVDEAPLTGRVTVKGELRLPAISALAPWLPPQLDVEDLGAILADLDLRYDGQARPPHFTANIDLGATDWLDRASIAASGDTAAVRLDSLVVRLPGLALSGAGTVSRDSVHAEIDLHLPDGSLLQRWRDPALAGADLSATVHLEAAGAWPLPQVDLTADLSLATPQLSIPHLSLTAAATADTILVSLALPEGLQSPSLPLDRVSFDFAGAAADSLRKLRGAFGLDFRAPRAGVRLVGSVNAENLLTLPAGTINGDTLAVDLDGRDFANSDPWQITFDAADSSLTVTGFELAGTLGDLGLEAAVRPDSVAAEISVAVQVALDALAAAMPPEYQALLPAGTVTVDGSLEVAGAPLAPWARGRLRLAFTDNPELDGLSVETHLSLGTGGEPPASLDPGRAAWRQHSARMDLSLRDADTVLTHISALVPLPHPDAKPDSVDVSLDADGMDLARLQPLLPGGITIEGRLDADTHIAGLMTPGDTNPELDLSGDLRLTDLQLRAPDGSWIAMKGNVELDGTSLAPMVRGGLDIGPGLIRLPEPPPTLLPATGEALLWETAAPAPDSLAVAAADSAGDLAAPLPGIIPDLVFNIRCPGGLWLRGQGLDVELEGDLVLHLRDGLPTIEGELEARQGTMKQLGRVFKLERGRIIFYADESELNPELDIALSVRVGQYDITISLSGTANDPLLEFSSSPDLGDGDIISVLLFGKTSDELNEGQSGLMADRAGEIALAYGSARLQENVAKELGVDVLTIAPRDGDSDTSSLTVGKYLNPKVMVRYEQVLSQNSAFFVHLDYSLTESQVWKLHTQVSQGEASGIEIRWEKDW